MNHGRGRITESNGGLFTVRLFETDAHAPLDGMVVTGRGRGKTRRDTGLLVGDIVRVSYDATAYSVTDGGIAPAMDGRGLSIDAIEERKNSLIRPPMSNLDTLFVTVSVASPAPLLETVDKLISIAEFNEISPVIVLTKCDLDPREAERLAEIYRRAGFPVFCTGLGMEKETEALAAFLGAHGGTVSAFSGASGVGKSTLLNRLFPNLKLETGEISLRIERGKNTTRRVTLFPLSEGEDTAYLADTPGFTMLDFERFDFFDKEALPTTFREFLPYIGECKYTKCSHTKEEGCAILAAVRAGSIPRSRHESFLSLYDVLKKKTKW